MVIFGQKHRGLGDGQGQFSVSIAVGPQLDRVGPPPLFFFFESKLFCGYSVSPFFRESLSPVAASLPSCLLCPLPPSLVLPLPLHLTVNATMQPPLPSSGLTPANLSALTALQVGSTPLGGHCPSSGD